MSKLDEILDDAYQLGRTDALLSANDYEIIMPKMKVEAEARSTTARQQMLRELMAHKQTYMFLSQPDVEAVPVSVIQHKLDEINGKEQRKWASQTLSEDGNCRDEQNINSSF